MEPTFLLLLLWSYSQVVKLWDLHSLCCLQHLVTEVISSTAAPYEPFALFYQSYGSIVMEKTSISQHF